MGISDNYDLKEIIKELETAIQIDGVDFELPSVEQLLYEVKRRISRQYQIDLNAVKLNDVALELDASRNSAIVLLDNLTRLHGKLAGYGQILRWKKHTEISLAAINYLGYTEDSLKTALIVLQRSSTQPRAVEALKAIKEKLPAIPMCTEKRLFVLLVVTMDIGCAELAACIAEILYMGML